MHLAGQSSVFRAQQDPLADAQTNIIGTLQLLEQLRHYPRLLVYPSTIAVYRSRSSGRSVETEAQPHSFYAAGKLVVENYIRLYSEQYAVPGVSLRLGYVYANDVTRGPFADICGAVSRGEKSVKLFASLRSSFDFIHVNDVASAMEAVLRRDLPAGTVLNISTGEATEVKEILRLATEHVGVSLPKVLVKSEAKPVRLVMDCRVARRLLGWRPRVSLNAGIKDYLLNYGRK